MCGIAGIGSREPVPDPGLVERMRDTMCHRGPDDSGSWTSSDGRIVLAHRRLSVIDLSQGARQPMADNYGRFHITFNGEIYNYRELRKELENLGHWFRTQSDTEVLLEAYREWGLNLLERLNGMFAFALYDGESRRLFLARDRVGEKPLFYRHAGGALIFASELKALLADPGIPRLIDPTSMDYYLAYGYVPGESCIVQGVQKLGAAQAMTYSPEKDELCTWKYWTLPKSFSGSSPTSGELIEELEQLLVDSVRFRLIADVPIGILLSGGMDSSLVTAMAAGISTSRIKTFTAIFPGHGKYDEGAHARLIAEAFGTEHEELAVDPASVDLLPILARQYDEPIGDHSIIPTYLLSRLIRNRVTVALGGDGGDELFGGYPHYNFIQRMENVRRYLPVSLQWIVAKSAAALLPVGTRGRNHLIGLGGGQARSIAHINLYFDRRTRDRLLPSVFRNRLQNGNPSEAYKENFWDGRNSVFQNASRTDFHTTLVDDYLVKMDRASMLASLETRAPFLDHRIVEFAFSKVPDALRASRNKRKILLRLLSSKRLPKQFDPDRKQGFELPMASWFKGDWGRYIQSVLCKEDGGVFDEGLVRELLEGQRRGYANANRLFQLTMFELWRREYRMEMPSHENPLRSARL